MISLFTGSPGSGKSLHLANVIYKRLKSRKKNLTICNFKVSEKYFKKEEYEKFLYVETFDMLPKTLWEIGEDFLSKNKFNNVNEKEHAILLCIDECQLLFNARDWQKNSKAGWTTFFSLHRHIGFQVILVTQMDTSIDKQVRGLVEYNCLHRKVKNMGTMGFFANLLVGGGLFRCNEIWYPQNLYTDGYWFKYHKKLDDLYDTHALFDSPVFPSRQELEDAKDKKNNNCRAVKRVNYG